MTDFLINLYGMSKQDAFSLAWNGITSAKVFKEAPSSELFAYNYKENNINKTMSISKQEIMNRATAYNGLANYADEGIKGSTVCPN